MNAQRIFFFFSVIMQITAIAFTKSWGALLGIGLLVVLFKFTHVIFQKRRMVIVGLIFLVIASIGIWGRLQTEKGFVAESRERIFHKVFTAGLHKPILGWGWANADYAFESVVWPIPLRFDVYVDKAHSTILEVFATTGLLGLILYLTILFRTLKVLVHNLKSKNKVNYLWYETLLIAFILYLFHSQTNVISIGEEVFFWIILGIARNQIPDKLDELKNR